MARNLIVPAESWGCRVPGSNAWPPVREGRDARGRAAETVARHQDKDNTPDHRPDDEPRGT